MTKDSHVIGDPRTSKAAWLEAFRNELEEAGLPKADVDDALSFFSEVIDNQIDEGLSEEAALSTLDIEKTTRTILDEIPLQERMEARFDASDTVHRAVIVTLLVIGFPLWGSLLMAAGAVLISLLVTLFALAISAWIIVGSLLLTGIAGVVLLVQGIAASVPWSGLFAFGCGTVAAGMAVLATPPLAMASTWMFRVMMALVRKAASLFSHQPKEARDIPGIRLRYPKPLLLVGSALIAIGGISRLVALVACGFDPTTLPPLPQGPFSFYL